MFRSVTAIQFVVLSLIGLMGGKRKSSGGAGAEAAPKAVKTADPTVLKILAWPLDFAS